MPSATIVRSCSGLPCDTLTRDTLPRASGVLSRCRYPDMIKRLMQHSIAIWLIDDALPRARKAGPKSFSHVHGPSRFSRIT